MALDDRGMMTAILGLGLLFPTRAALISPTTGCRACCLPWLPTWTLLHLLPSPPPARRALLLAAFARGQKLDGYIETSAMTESDQVSKVFEEAARLALGKEPQFMPEETEPGCFPFLECKFFN